MAQIAIAREKSDDDSPHIDRLLEIGKLFAATESSYEDYSESYYGVERRTELERQAVERAKEAVVRWKQLHYQLVTSLRDGTIPSVATLMNNARELKALVERLKESAE